MKENEQGMNSARSRVRDAIIDYLRELIIGGELAPGDTLHESELTKRFGTSRSPVREALLHLEQDGLVQIVPKKGTIVTPIDPDQLKQALFIRTALESTNIELLCQTITSEQLRSLRENLLQQKSLLEFGEFQSVFRSFDQFHLLLCEFNKLPRIWEIVRKEKLSLDRLHALERNHWPRLELLYAQHEAIADALEARDARTCVELIQTHADLDFEAKNMLSVDKTHLESGNRR
ncbi:MAG: GntR family transcriptional regulator [Actinomycetota bacterium]